VRDVLAIEVNAGAVRCLHLAGIGPGRSVRAYAERPLPPRVLVPSGTLPNIQDEAAFATILRDLLGARPHRWARLVVPDRSVRLVVLNMDTAVPQGPDLRRFVVWRLQEALLFDPQEARVAFVPAPDGVPERQVAVTLVAREQVVAQYERLLGAAGTRVAHVAPAACHLFNLAAAEGAGQTPAVHAFLALGEESATLIMSLRGIPHYVRTFPRPPGPPPEGRSAPQAFPSLARELARTFCHAADTQGLGPPVRLSLAEDGGAGARLAASLEAELGIPCGTFSPARGLRWARGLPRQAHAVLAAALASI
jgi:hypothetical protein